MSIKINKERNGTHTVLLVKSVRKPGAKYPSTVTLKSFGKLEDLIKKDPDIIEKLKAEYDIKNQRLYEYIKVPLSEVLDLKNSYNDTVHNIFDQADKQNENPYEDEKPLIQPKVFNVGYLILEKIYKQLKIDEFLDSVQSNRKIKFKIDDAVKLHVFSRILYPDSVLQSNKGKNRFYKGIDVNLIDSYRVLDLLFDNRYLLQEHIFNETNKHNIDTILFDETNYYISQDEPKGLAQKGVSKEHQVTPIIQFALMMDDEGIPLCFDLFEGNTKDSTMFPPLVFTWKNRYKQSQQVTFIADKGNNCGANIIMTHKNGDYYCFAQRVKGSKESFASWVLDDNGYENIGEDYKYKERIVKNTYNRQEKQANGNYKIVETMEIEEKQIAFWSKNFAMRDNAKREAKILSSAKTVDNPGFLKMEENRGRHKYVKLTVNGDIEYELDQDKIIKDAKYDGYYAIITNNINLDKKDVLATYKKQPAIEEKFKITKSLFKLRPIYLFKDEHIRAHFLTGYISLVIISVLHKKIIDAIKKETDIEPSFSYERLIAVLRDLEVIELSHDIYKLKTLNKDILLVTKILNIPLVRENYKKDMIDSIFK
jgi:hypothetical protein